MHDTGLRIGGYLPTSFLDWEGRVAAVLFLNGCNLRCPFCHNAALALGQVEPLNERALWEDLFLHKPFLDGIVLSGGEPTIQPEIIPFLRVVRKEIGLEVKLDTNGFSPDLLETLLTEGLVDKIALDVKAPLSKYSLLSGRELDTVALGSFKRSLDLIQMWGIDYELRTTYVPALLTKGDLLEIKDMLKNDPHWVVQCFRSLSTLDPTLAETSEPSPETIKEWINVRVRGG